MLLTDADIDGLEAKCDIPGFNVLATLGEGGFAMVYKAEDVKSGDIFAVKAVRKQMCEAAALSLEIETMHSLDHDNILKLCRHFEGEHHHFLALEVCCGDLFGRMEFGPLAEQDAALTLFQVFRALEHMHKRCVAHRDVKPENVLFAADGPIKGNVVKLADFGLAAKFEGRSLNGSAGTQLYAAPEMFQDAYGPECDLWSAGVLLYNALAGQEPFEECSSREYSFPSEQWRAISYGAKRLVTELLEPDVALRLGASEALDHAWFQLHRCRCSFDAASEASTALEEAVPAESESEPELFSLRRESSPRQRVLV